MKTKLVVWGTQQNADETTQRVLVAFELKAEDNKVCSWIIRGDSASDDLERRLREDWKKDAVIVFPDDHTYVEFELSANAPLLPPTIRTESEELLKRTQTEWLFVVLSTRLFENQLESVNEIRQRVEGLTKYDKAVWDELKELWDRIQAHIKEQNLSKDHASALRERTNELFDALKQLRKAEDDAFERESKANYDKFIAEIETIEQSALLEGANLKNLFESLKNLQRNYNQSRLTRDMRSQLWERIDNAFKTVKERRQPGYQHHSRPVAGNTNAESDGSPDNRLARRIEGLRQAMSKMQESIDRDQSEMDFQNKKISSGNATQLESQLREVRSKLIKERIDSKKVKLDDMSKTLRDLENKLQRRLDKIKKGETPEADETDAELSAVELEISGTDQNAETTDNQIENNDNTAE